MSDIDTGNDQLVGGRGDQVAVQAPKAVMTRAEALRHAAWFVHLWLCDACLDGMGGECHTPGCALWINRAPDISLRNSPFVTIMDAETAYVRDIAGTLIGLFRDSRSDGWRARTSGARLKRLAHEAGLPAPDPARRENQALTAYEELDAAHAAALETVDALDADNARLAAELSACRQNNTAIAVQLDQYRGERDDARALLAEILTELDQWELLVEDDKRLEWRQRARLEADGG